MTRGKHRGLSIASLILACASTPPLDGIAQETPLFKVDATTVVVDVVVRDKKGRSVTDLGPADFELLEDGVAQQIGQVVAPAGARSADFHDRRSNLHVEGANGTEAVRPAETTPSFLALVFDRLSPDGRALACQGVESYLRGTQAKEMVAVFSIDLSLATVQTYTSDRERVISAVKQVAVRASTSYPKAAMESAQDGQALPPALRTARELDAQGQWERLERDQQGYASTDALMAIAASLSRIPGRKTIVFIAEGLALPDNVFPHFQDVVATANRGNVAIYAMDAAGLRVQSTQAETAAEINNAGRMAVEVGADGTSGGGVAFMERLSGTLRKDPHAALTLLAAQTGGFLMDGSNDLAKSLQAIEIDQQSYYLLTYTPRNMDFRGEWRRLAIRVPGREVTVRGRSGYVAVRASGSQPLLAYEGPALAALDRKTEPKDIPIRAMTLQFPEPNGGTAVAVFLTAPAADLLFRSSADTYSTDATLFARIRGADGAVLQKASEPVRLNGPTLDLPRARAASLALYRHLVLAPGSYLLEGVVHDGLAGRAGVSRVPFTIEPSPPAALRVSSIVLVGQADAIQGAGNSDDPLRLGAVQLMPSGGQPIRKSMVSKLTFFYTAVAPGSDKPTATLEFLRGESLVATVPLTIPDAGPAGSIQHLARLPLDTLVPGEYVLRLIVRQGAQRQVREAPFQLLP